jgi:hypothetical protein
MLKLFKYYGTSQRDQEVHKMFWKRNPFFSSSSWIFGDQT